MIGTLAGLLASTALAASYGQIDQEGDPSYLDRDLHMWTNVVRVAPQLFESEYNSGGCSYQDFEDSEQEPHPPLYYDRNLNVAAVFHSTDMYDSGNFSHDSSDGTSFATRVAGYYSDSGYVGENIAYGYGTGYNAIFSGWMCSSGHRSNIMGDYNELGTGVVSDYMTQDFGAGNLDTTSPVAMGLHFPERPTDEAEFFVDWQDADAPAELRVILNGQPLELELEWGTSSQGVFAGTGALSGEEGCSEYYVRWATKAGVTGTFPETGSYTFGACDDLGWIDDQMCVLGINCASADEIGAGIELIGCATSGGGAAWTGVAVGAALITRRRRRLA